MDILGRWNWVEVVCSSVAGRRSSGMHELLWTVPYTLVGFYGNSRGTSPCFPGILLFRKPSNTQGKQPVFAKNDDEKEWGINLILEKECPHKWSEVEAPHVQDVRRKIKTLKCRYVCVCVCVCGGFSGLV